MDTFGDVLKQAREAKGIPLRDMAVRTKISVGALEALERNDFRKLPGGIFGRSFVRTYALEAGLDPDETVRRFGDELAESERADAERRRKRQPEITLDDRQFLERQRRAFLLLRVGLVVGVLAVLAIVAWLFRAEWAPQAFDGSAAQDPTLASQSSPPSPGPETAVPAAGDVSAGASVAAATEALLGSSPIVLELEFTADCWTTVGTDGKSDRPRLYRAGDRARFEASNEILVDAGNAGAVRAAINGKPAKSFGATGARVLTRLTRENLGEFY
jgi:cytoskeletal protein RodZ